MLGLGSNGDELSDRERFDLQREQTREQQDRGTAQQLANQVAAQSGPTRGDGYWDLIQEPDVDPKDEQDSLSNFASVELSGAFPTAGVKYSDWESWKWRAENETFVMKNEFQSADSKLDDVDMATMGYGKRPKLTDEKARQLRALSEVMKAKRSLAIGARGLKSGTEIHAVSRHESAEDQRGRDPLVESGGGGKLSGLKRWLQG